jgi:hypothetical protein
MISLREMQQNFLGYLLDESRSEIVQRVVSTPQRPAQKRLHYYAVGYRLRLKEVLRTDYERLHAYVGDKLMEQLMDAYIDRYPSRYTSLRDYGQHMHDLVRTLEPFSQLPEIAEITQVELAFNRSFDSQDRTPVDWSAFTQLEPGVWPGMKLEFHDSVQLIKQNYNSFQVWQALSDEQTPPEKIKQQSAWVIWRQDLVSRYRSLNAAELCALDTAIAGGDFAQVCENLLPICGNETAQQVLTFLQQWANDGMITGMKNKN